MEKNIFLLLIFFVLSGCSTNSPNNNNPYLPNYAVNVEINLRFYPNLKFMSNAVYIPNQDDPKFPGIIVFNNSGTTYNAFDAACPNQALSACSTMTIKGIMTVCPCDNAEYSLFSGQSKGKTYPMKQYRVEVKGDMLRVYN